MSNKLYRYKISDLLQEGTFRRILAESNKGHAFEVAAASWIAGKPSFSQSSQHTSSMYPDIDIVKKAGKGKPKSAGAEAKMNFDASLGNFSASDLTDFVYDYSSNTISTLTFAAGTKIDPAVVTAIQNAINGNIDRFRGMYEDFKDLHTYGLQGKRYSTVSKGKANANTDPVEHIVNIIGSDEAFPTTWEIKKGGQLHTNMPLAKEYFKTGFTGMLDQSGPDPLQGSTTTQGYGSGQKGRSKTATRSRGGRFSQTSTDNLEITKQLKADLGANFNWGAEEENEVDLSQFSLEPRIGDGDGDTVAFTAELPPMRELVFDGTFHASKQVCSPRQCQINGAAIMRNIASHNTAYLIVGQGDTFNVNKCWIGKVGTADPLNLFPKNAPAATIPSCGVELRFTTGSSLQMTPKAIGTPDFAANGFVKIGTVIK